MVDIDNTVKTLAAYDVNAWISPHVREYVEPGDTPWPTFWHVQSQPETPLPYIRFNVSTDIADVWFKRFDRISYAIFDNDLSNSDKVFSIMVELLSRESDTAKELNGWLRERETEDDRDRNFKFHTFEFQGGGFVDPQAEEGGAFPRIFSIRYEYSVLKGLGIR